MLQHHNELVKEQIALYHGHIVKTLGDSYMVSFDAARNAITCAIGVQRQLAQYNANQDGPRVEIGIGINMGEPIREGDDLFGTSVNLASRICAAAGPGEIFVSETVRQVVSHLEGAEYVDRGFKELKGFADAQRLFEVDWSGREAMAVTATAPLRATRLDGPVPVAALPARRRPPLLPIGGAVVALALLVGGGWFLTRGQSAPPPTPTVAAKADVPKPKEILPTVGAALAAKVATEVAAKPAAASPAPAAQVAASPAASPAVNGVISADSFDNPNQRKFRETRSGSDRAPAVGGAFIELNWDYRYDQGELLTVMRTRWPQNVQRGNAGMIVESTDRIQGDVAIEITARATKLPDQARYGFGLDYGGEDLLTFTVSPSESGYLSAFGRRLDARQQVVSGRSDAIQAGNQPNRLRLEKRGGALRYLVNGQEVGQAPHPKPSLGVANVELYTVQTAPGPGPELEVRFDDYRVLSLAGNRP